MSILCSSKNNTVIMVTVVIQFFVFTHTLQAQQFNRHIVKQISLSSVHADSTKEKFKIEYREALLRKDTLRVLNQLIWLSTLERVNLNYNMALEYAGEAVFLAEEYDDVLLKAKAHEEFGVLNYLFKQDSVAGYHFEKSLVSYRKHYASHESQGRKMVQAYYNMVVYYQRLQLPKMLTAYVDSCMAIADTINEDKYISVFFDEKRASVLLLQDDRNEALNILLRAVDKLERIEKGSNSAVVNRGFLVILYARIATMYSEDKQNELAKTYYRNALGIEDFWGEQTFYRAYVHRRYAELLYRTGEYQLAHNHLLEAQKINEHYLNPRNDRTQGFLSVKNRYMEELDKKNDELQRKGLEIEKSKRQLLQFRIFFFVILFGAIVILLVFYFRKLKQKHEREQIINEGKHRESKQLLDQKNKELSANTLQLIEKEEQVAQLKKHLEKYSIDNSTKVLLNSIDKQSGNLWEAFNSRFMELNQDFYERLRKAAPDLSAADLKICALIKLNFSGKEMAHLLGISPGSVNVARHRLRKKLSIDRDKNLTQYINMI